MAPEAKHPRRARDPGQSVWKIETRGSGCCSHWSPLGEPAGTIGNNGTGDSRVCSPNDFHGIGQMYWGLMINRVIPYSSGWWVQSLGLVAIASLDFLQEPMGHLELHTHLSISKDSPMIAIYLSQKTNLLTSIVHLPTYLMVTVNIMFIHQLPIIYRLFTHHFPWLTVDSPAKNNMCFEHQDSESVAESKPDSSLSQPLQPHPWGVCACFCVYYCLNNRIDIQNSVCAYTYIVSCSVFLPPPMVWVPR